MRLNHEQHGYLSTLGWTLVWSGSVHAAGVVVADDYAAYLIGEED